MGSPKHADSRILCFPPCCRKSTLRWLPSCRSFEVGCRSVWWAARTTLRLLSSWERGMKVGQAGQTQLRSPISGLVWVWGVRGIHRPHPVSAKEVEGAARCFPHCFSNCAVSTDREPATVVLEKQQGMEQAESCPNVVIFSVLPAESRFPHL